MKKNFESLYETLGGTYSEETSSRKKIAERILKR